MPSVALADGTCGTATEVAITSGKLAKDDVNGDGIICQLGVKVLGKGNPKPSYADNSSCAWSGRRALDAGASARLWTPFRPPRRSARISLR